MTAELRNLPHIASMAFNEPLMLEPAYARVFFCALAGQLGISRLTDAVSGDSLTAGEAPAALALSVDDDGPRQARSYQVMNGIAVLPVSGTLVSRTRALQPYSGMTGYNGIIARLQQATSDPMVDGILLDMDTPGGMVAGAFDCADIIARMRDIKPVWALANDMNCSAGQLLASAASRRLVTQTARTGSIGVMMAHSNYGAALEKQGVEITLIYSGSHKVDGNPYSHLPDDVRETLQSRMDATRRMFAQKVSAYTGLSVQAVLDMLPAQFTDVATQLAGGQSPWLILLQQGGQVKDSFGGMIPMFRGLAGAITLPMVGATSLAVATGALAYAWYQGNSTLSDFNKTLVLSGNQAGLTADRMLVLSRAGQAAGLTFNQTSESLSALVKAGVSGEAQIASISQSVARFSSASGVEV
ncbi:phage tail length tape measure family protein, partial [Escherichia coli]